MNDDEPNAGASDELAPYEGHFTSLIHASALPPKWVIADLIPEGLVLVGGPPKEAKKSTLTMAVMGLVAGYEGRVLPEEFRVESPGPVLVFSFEATAGEMRYVMQNELGIQLKDDDGILVADRPEDFLLDSATGMTNILYWLDARRPRLVIIDPLRNAHTLDEKDSGDLVRILMPLRRWAKENHCAVIVVHHTRKLAEKDADRAYTAMDMRGSSALYGLADGVIMITPRPQPMTFIYQASFKRGVPWERTIMLAAYETKGQVPGEALRPLDLTVIKILEHGFTRLDDIARESNLARQTIKERLDHLVRIGRVHHSKAGGYTLPKGDTE